MPQFETTDQAIKVLDFIAESRRRSQETGEMMPLAAEEAMNEINLPEEAYGAWDYARDLDQKDPMRKQIREKVYESLAEKLPPRTKSLIDQMKDLPNRAKVMNTIDENPELISEFYRKKGYQTEIRDGVVLFKKPEEPQFAPVDPPGLDTFDLADLLDEIVEFGGEMASTGAKVVGAFGGGVPGFLAGSGVGAATMSGIEAGKQSVAKSIGTREKYDLGQIGEQGLWGFAGLGLGKALSYPIKGVGKLFNRSSELRSDAKEIKEAAETIGAEATPAQLRQSQDMRFRENAMLQMPEGWANMTIKERADSINKAVDNAVESAMSQRSVMDSIEAGSAIEKSLRKELDDYLRPSEQTYRKLSAIYDQTGIKPDVSDVVVNIDELFRDSARVLKISPSGRTLLKEAENILQEPDVNMKKLNSVIESIGELTRTLKADPKEGATVFELSNINDLLNEARHNALVSLEKTEPNLFKGIAEELKTARNQYRAAAESIRIVTTGKRSKQGSPRGLLEDFLNVSEEKRAGKLMPKDAFKRLEIFKKEFPETFEVVRQAKITDIYKKSLNKDGTINKNKMITALDQFTDRQQKLLLGDDHKIKIDAVKKLIGSLPENVGPSGTPRGNAFINNVFGFLDFLTLGAASQGETLRKRLAYEFLLSDFARKSGIVIKKAQGKGLSGAIGASTIGGLSNAIQGDEPFRNPPSFDQPLPARQ